MAYMFARCSVTAAKEVTEYLNSFVKDGWRVVSHAESDGEYSFVLEKV